MKNLKIFSTKIRPTILPIEERLIIGYQSLEKISKPTFQKGKLFSSINSPIGLTATLLHSVNLKANLY